MSSPESFNENTGFSTSSQSEASTRVPSGLSADVVRAYKLWNQLQLPTGVSVRVASNIDLQTLPIEVRIYPIHGEAGLHPIRDIDIVPLREAWIGQWQLLDKISRSLPPIRVQTATQTAADLLKCRQKSTKEIVEDIAASSKIRNADRIASRLSYLAEVCREEAPEQAPISRTSLHDTEQFLRSVPMLAYPSLVVTVGGNLRAEWKGKPKKHLAIEFLGDQTIRFVIFVPDRQRPSQINRASGAAHLNSVLELLHPYGLSEWVLENSLAHAR